MFEACLGRQLRKRRCIRLVSEPNSPFSRARCWPLLAAAAAAPTRHSRFEVAADGMRAARELRQEAPGPRPSTSRPSSSHSTALVGAATLVSQLRLASSVLASCSDAAGTLCTSDPASTQTAVDGTAAAPIGSRKVAAAAPPHACSSKGASLEVVAAGGAAVGAAPTAATVDAHADHAAQLSMLVAAVAERVPSDGASNNVRSSCLAVPSEAEAEASPVGVTAQLDGVLAALQRCRSNRDSV